MYEPIRTKSVHSMAEPKPDFPHRSREEELDIRLAGHLTALLTVTDELRTLTPDPALDDAAQRLAEQATRLRDGHAPLRAAPTAAATDPAHIAALHQRAHTLAGWALVVATSRDDTAATTLAAERMRSHATALGLAA
ncbi:hypothetical protein V2J94_39890 [Streptomyces sp. DSM 41524]|uniref:Uncharacterized protein n=1 Tax=Streptomyces asiaticus subsp. ignotus TaxID=3098222 RepID=A0ABU7QC71_9ACTN|nr:hypothetical protein [Streptomyces sp. DASNCL29]MEE4597964.1 hypothetical protein [Streptomyces sp. DSM 41524]TMU92693.1 hypothetical protein FGK60_24470 [Streptomyces sp. DASNCL29]